MIRMLLGLLLALSLTPAAQAQTPPQGVLQNSWKPRTQNFIGFNELKFICIPRYGRIDTIEFVVDPLAAQSSIRFWVRFLPKSGGQYQEVDFQQSGTSNPAVAIKPGTYDIEVQRQTLGNQIWSGPRYATAIIPDVTIPNVLAAGGGACATTWPAGAPRSKMLALGVVPSNFGYEPICERTGNTPIKTVRITIPEPRPLTGVHHFVFRNIATGAETRVLESVNSGGGKFAVPPGSYEVRIYYQPIGSTSPPVGQIHAYYPKIVVAPNKLVKNVPMCGAIGGPR